MGSFEDKKHALSGASVCNWRAEAVAQSQEFRKEYATRPNVIPAEEMPWEDSPDGRIKHLINRKMRTPELCVEAYMLFLDAGKRSGKHRHMWEELAFVVEGEGYDLHWDMMFDCQEKFIWEWDAEPKKFEWKQGDYIYVPPYTNHQSFATKDARIIVMSNPLIKDMGFDWLDQLENAPGFEHIKVPMSA
jgi:quercetin dioxygenase-like cupin family protein